MKALVTGGAGFIGSSLCEALLGEGYRVVAFDDLSTGSLLNISSLMGSAGFEFVKGDCRKGEDVHAAMKGVDRVFHLAAIAEVRPELYPPTEVIEHNVFGTQVLLEASITSDIESFAFASSSTVYGEPTVLPTPEDYSPLEPISIYGATKLASEGIISGYVGTYGLNAVVLRLANIVGERSHRGVIHDFVTKLTSDPSKLEILGDGSQAKSYLYVEDCVRAFLAAGRGANGFEAYNVGSEDQVNVREMAAVVSKSMGLKPMLHFTGGVDGGRGWKGDVKSMLLDVHKIRRLGWKPSGNSIAAVQKTVSAMLTSSAP